MRIGVISDLHIERRFGVEDHSKKGAYIKPTHGMDALKDVLAAHKANPIEVLVVAGDFSTGHHLVPDLMMLSEMFNDIQIVFVAGNHEYYGVDRGRVNDYYRTVSAKCPNIHWLNRTTWSYKNVLFAGTTLWYPWNHEGDLVLPTWADATQIQGFKNWVYDVNEKDRKFLEHIIGSHDGPGPYERELVVVTHMAPGWGAIYERWYGKPETHFFVGGCDRMLGAKYTWIHGHSHEDIDIMLGETRVVRNPLGYEFQPTTGWNPAYVIEVAP